MAHQNLTWSGKEIAYDGFPLMLRRPDHSDIWQHKERFPQLVAVQHLLDKVMSNGLPEKNYNETLSSFDHHMCSLVGGDGLIFLIETYAGKRNYYYYTTPGCDINNLINQAKMGFNVNLVVTIREDSEWSFLKEYPVLLFKPA